MLDDEFTGQPSPAFGAFWGPILQTLGNRIKNGFTPSGLQYIKDRKGSDFPNVPMPRSRPWWADLPMNAFDGAAASAPAPGKIPMPHQPWWTQLQGPQDAFGMAPGAPMSLAPPGGTDMSAKSSGNGFNLGDLFKNSFFGSHYAGTGMINNGWMY